MTAEADFILKTEGSHVIFKQRRPTIDEWRYFTTTFYPTDESLQHLQLTVESALSLSDIRRLIDYFENHIAALIEAETRQPGVRYEPVRSPVWVGYDTFFQLQALDGTHGKADSDSYFSLLFLMDTYPKGGQHHNYFGGESTIYFHDVEAFIVSLNHLLQEAEGE